MLSDIIMNALSDGTDNSAACVEDIILLSRGVIDALERGAGWKWQVRPV